MSPTVAQLQLRRLRAPAGTFRENLFQTLLLLLFLLVVLVDNRSEKTRLQSIRQAG